MTSTPAPSAFRYWRIWAPTLILCAGFAGYYFFWTLLAERIEATLLAQQREQAARNLQIGWDTLDFSGFPYRLTVTMERPFAAAIEAGLQPTWRADRVSAYVLPYKPSHIIAEIEGTQRLTFTRDDSWPSRHWEIAATADENWASLVVEGNWPRARLAADAKMVDAMVTEQSGLMPDTHLTAGRLQLHTRPSPEDGRHTGFDLDMAVRADELRILSGVKIPALGPDLRLAEAQTRWRNLPKSFATDPRALLRQWRENDGELAISSLTVQWGPLDMLASGTLTLDEAGRPQGRLKADIAEPEKLIDALVEAGIVDGRQGRIALAGLTLATSLQTQTETGRLSVPILLQNGLVYLGPLVVADLPSVY